jgi:hypothetical protein
MKFSYGYIPKNYAERVTLTYGLIGEVLGSISRVFYLFIFGVAALDLICTLLVC